MDYPYDLHGWYTSEVLPGRSTTIEPPTLSETTAPGELRANWTGHQWLVLPYTEPPPAPEPIAARAAAWERIKAMREKLSDEGGYKVAVNGVDKWFHSDAKSKTQQLSLVVMGANVPPVQWKTMDGSKVTMTQALAGAIFSAAATQDMTLFAVAESHRAAMEAAADPDSYDFSAGWPEVYQP